MSNALEIKNVCRSFFQGGQRLDILKDFSESVSAGEIVALMGPSGSGKSTLLQIAGLLEKPDSGEVSIAGASAGALGDGARTALRREKIGFVYQFHNLLPEFSAIENVMLPQMIAGVSRKLAAEKARVLLNTVGLSHRLEHRPSELSGGEQQRVAIARALANSPRLILADEPTGNLDLKTGDSVFELLLQTVRLTGAGALVATHNPDLARRMDRIIEMGNL